jgi:Leucine-rich repeat (LRR) protein
MLAPEIAGNGAMRKLSLADNRLGNKESGKALAEALATNSVLKELDLSSNDLSSIYSYHLSHDHTAEFAAELAIGIKDNGALTILDVSANKLCDGAFGMDDLGPAIAHSKITSLNVSGNNLRINRGIEHITNIIDKGAVTKLDISSNHIGAEQERDLQRICVASGIELAK